MRRKAPGVAKATAGRTEWFSYVILGITWRVVLADPGDPLLSDKEGVHHASTDNASATIAIDRTQNDDQIVECFIHENKHASLYQSGANTVLRDLFGLSEDEWYEREEDIVRLMAPVETDSLVRSGLLKLPPIPRGGGNGR